jgi:hypothetical protein
MKNVKIICFNHKIIKKMKNIDQIDLLIIISISITIRYLIGLWGYSGYNIPPMYGDFEAQRHWMEITISIPIGNY